MMIELILIWCLTAIAITLTACAVVLILLRMALAVEALLRPKANDYWRYD